MVSLKEQTELSHPDSYCFMMQVINKRVVTPFYLCIGRVAYYSSIVNLYIGNFVLHSAIMGISCMVGVRQWNIIK